MLSQSPNRTRVFQSRAKLDPLFLGVDKSHIQLWEIPTLKMHSCLSLLSGSTHLHLQIHQSNSLKLIEVWSPEDMPLSTDLVHEMPTFPAWPKSKRPLARFSSAMGHSALGTSACSRSFMSTQHGAAGKARI